MIAGLDRPAATLLTAGFVAASAALGVVIMVASGRPLPHYGFRAPGHQRATYWAAPLFVAPILVIALSGFAPARDLVLPYLMLTLAVGLNEEIWFRGLAMAAVRRLGTKRAIIGSSLLFGLVHLANVLAGRPGPYLALQFGFAVLVGFVLAEIVSITGSLWVAIAWHAAYDFVSFNSGAAEEDPEILASAVVTVILLGYAVLLWRRLPPAGRAR